MTTLKDISKATSLSLSTVSAVLGGRAEKLAISRKTIEKVLACAEELDYHPDLSARTLRSSESKIIGLLMPNIKVEFWQNMILDLQKEIGRYDGYILLSALWDNSTSIKKCMRDLLCRKVDGIITSHAVFLPENFHLPVASYDKDPSTKFDTVLYGKREALEKCLAYAVSLGHKRIALAGDAEGDGNKLFLELAPKYNIIPVIQEQKEKNIIIDDSFYYSNTHILDENNGVRPSFVISLNNLTTLNILKRAAELSLKVPNDLSILAIDDSYIYPFLTPAITSFIRSEEGFPSLLLKTLFARMKNMDMEQKIIIPEGKFIERNSCCKYNKK